MDSVTLSILFPALVAGLIILLSHVPLGTEVLRRGIIFIDIAIAQVAGLGIVFADYLGFDAHGFELQIIALTSALTGAALLGLVERKAGRHQEAIIGVVFILAATASILLLAKNPHGGEHLESLLVGQILWAEWQQLVLPALMGVAVFGLWFFQPQLLKGKAFYFIFAVAITLSVQVVGVYLVFASLILPALAVLTLSERRNVYMAIGIGWLSYGLGLIISSVADLPSGAVIVWTLGGD